MDWQQIITYLLNDAFVFLFCKMLLNIICTIMICGLIKAGLKQITKLSDKLRRLIQMASNMVVGGILGYILYDFKTDINILLGAACGFTSAIIYRVIIKQIYDKFGINCEDDAEGK